MCKVVLFEPPKLIRLKHGRCGSKPISFRKEMRGDEHWKRILDRFRTRPMMTKPFPQSREYRNNEKSFPRRHFYAINPRMKFKNIKKIYMESSTRTELWDGTILSWWWPMGRPAKFFLSSMDGRECWSLSTDTYGFYCNEWNGTKARSKLYAPECDSNFFLWQLQEASRTFHFRLKRDSLDYLILHKDPRGRLRTDLFTYSFLESLIFII